MLSYHCCPPLVSSPQTVLILPHPAPTAQSHVSHQFMLRAKCIYCMELSCWGKVVDCLSLQQPCRGLDAVTVSKQFHFLNWKCNIFFTLKYSLYSFTVFAVNKHRHTWPNWIITHLFIRSFGANNHLFTVAHHYCRCSSGQE